MKYAGDDESLDTELVSCDGAGELGVFACIVDRTENFVSLDIDLVLGERADVDFRSPVWNPGGKDLRHKHVFRDLSVRRTSDDVAKKV